MPKAHLILPFHADLIDGRRDEDTKKGEEEQEEEEGEGEEEW